MQYAIYVDFNTFGSGAVSLTSGASRRDLEKYGITLEENLKLILYMTDWDADGNEDDLIVSGVAHFEAATQRWVAKINWDQIKHTSELSDQEKISFGIA